VFVISNNLKAVFLVQKSQEEMQISFVICNHGVVLLLLKVHLLSQTVKLYD